MVSLCLCNVSTRGGVGVDITAVLGFLRGGVRGGIVGMLLSTIW